MLITERCCSGKARRLVQSRLRYASRHGHLDTPFPKKIKGIAATIVAHAQKPFGIVVYPETTDPDCPELGLYTQPYKLAIPPQYSIPYTEFDEIFTDIDGVLDDLMRSLNTQQLSLLELSGRERHEQFNAIGGKGLAEKLREEIALRVASWDNGAPTEISTQTAVAQLAGVQWAARIICCLTLELQL
ncbi:uncharacterized protein C8Q71DRAFT_728291, partial [Rhodofomes roseus]